MEDWGHYAARQSLAAELAARDVHLYHASEEDAAETPAIPRPFLSIPSFPRSLGFMDSWMMMRMMMVMMIVIITYYYKQIVLLILLFHYDHYANCLHVNHVLFGLIDFLGAVLSPSEDQLPLTPAKAAKASPDS